MFFGNITHLGYAPAKQSREGRPVGRPGRNQAKWNSSKAMTAGTVCR
jgi:hypothetical protein